MAATPKLLVNAQTLVFPGPIDNPRNLPRPVDKLTEAKSGARDTWTERTDYELTLIVRYVPRTTAGSATGYSVANGWTTALAWLRQGGRTATFYPDKDGVTTYTVELIDFDFDRDVVRSQGGARYDITLRLRSATEFTDY